MDRYEVQQKTRSISPELHVIRLGDIAIVTNPFEVFTQYGLQIKARSKALQTFIIQFCCDRMKYLPTEKAIRGGHYSAVVSSGLIGSEGGRQLVDWTVGQINQLM